MAFPKSPQHNPVRVEKKFPNNQCCFSQMSELVSYSALFEIVYYNWPQLDCSLTISPAPEIRPYSDQLLSIVNSVCWLMREHGDNGMVVQKALKLDGKFRKYCSR